MLKRIFAALSALSLSGALAFVCAAQQPPVVGAYEERPATDRDVVSAANFAVREEGRREGRTVSLLSIRRAERQVVAGFNYRLRLSVRGGGATREVSAVVYQDLKNRYSLSGWEMSGGEGAANASGEAVQERAADVSPAERGAVERAIKQELGRATSAHVVVSQFKVNSLDVQAGWALAGVEPSGDAQLDPVSVLLHKRRGRWKVLTLGTSLRGTGGTYHVPRDLRRKWGL